MSFDFNVSNSSCWGYSLINTLEFKKIDASARELADSLTYVPIYMCIYMVFDSDSNTIVFWWENCGSLTHQPGISVTYSYMCPYTFSFFLVGSSDWWHHLFLCGIMAVPWCIGLKAHRYIHTHALKPFFLLLVALTPYYFPGGIMAISWCTSSGAHWHIHIYDPIHLYIN